LLPAMIERGALAYDGLHATHTGRELCVFDVQFDIGGKWSGVAVWAQVVGPRDCHLTNCRQQGLAAEFPPGVGLSARPSRWLQIQSSGPAATVKDDAQQSVYFARDLLADGLRRFFSCGESTSGWEGRNRQICALTSTSSLWRPCSFRNSAISLSAFRAADRSGRDRVTVLPLTS
jgi:hypothetical protein